MLDNEEKFELELKRQNSVRELEQFFVTNKVDNLLEKIDEQKEKIVEEITKFAQEHYKPCKWNKDGEPILSKPALIIYIHLKKLQQIITKKNKVSTNIDDRDMKTGRLISESKGGQTSDREFEALAVHGLTATMEELSRPKADAIRAKNMMYNSINVLGDVDDDEVVIEKDDSMAKNLLNVYLIGSQLNSNLVNEDYLLPYTIKNRSRKVEREA